MENAILSPAKTLTDLEKDQIKSEIMPLVNQIVSNSENGNLDKAIEPYLNEPEFVSISNGHISHYSQFVDANKQFFEAMDSQKFMERLMDYKFINRETVIVTWGGSALTKMRDGQQVIIDPFTASLVFNKNNGKWKVVYSHESAISVEMETEPITPAEPVTGILADEERIAIEVVIKQLVSVLEKAMNQRDLDGSFNLMSDDPDFTFAEDGYIRPPKDSYYKIVKPIYDSFSDISMCYLTKRITVLGRDAAVFTGEGPFSATDLSGKETGGHLVSMFVFVRRNDKWQIVHGHSSHVWE